MPKRLLLLITLLLAPALLHAQEAKKEKKVLKNADIVTMVQNHFDDETLIKIIQVSETDFDVSEDALVDLMKQNVSTPVVRAMMSSAHKQHANKGSVTADPPASPSNPPDPSAPPPNAAASTPAATNQNFATRQTDPAADNPSASTNTATKTAAPANYPQQQMMAMPNPASMGVNPQQMAMLQARMASMGMGGMMGGMGMGMGGMGGGMYMNVPPEQMPHVFLKLHPEGKQEFSPSTAQIGQTNFKGSMGAGGMALRSLATEGLSFAAMGAGPAGMMAMSAFSMASGFMPGMRPGAPKMTYVWGLPGRKAAHELTETNPLFELNYGDIPGIDPDAYEPTVLHLVQSKDNYRLVGATQMKMTAKNMRNGGGPENGKWIDEDRWPCHVNKEERGFYVLHVDSPLEPGEYAVVLRPVKGYKSASSGLGSHAQVFYSVWDFSVPGATEQDGRKKHKK